MPQTPRPKRPHTHQDDANRLALIFLATQVLGRALITMHDGRHFTIHELSGGLYSVSEENCKFRCTTCNKESDEDPHAALALLYRRALRGEP